MWRMLVMLATRSLSCLQNCRVLQKALLCTAESRVKCSQLSLYVRESFCYQNGKILQRVLSSALSLSVFASDFFALEALCSCTAWQCDGCFGCDKQFMHWPSDKQLHAIKIKQKQRCFCSIGSQAVAALGHVLYAQCYVIHLFCMSACTACQMPT